MIATGSMRHNRHSTTATLKTVMVTGMGVVNQEDAGHHDCERRQALQADFVENGPRYTQWNVPLYDDVLWIVPGIHWRLSTNEENGSSWQDRTKPVPDG